MTKEKADWQKEQVIDWNSLYWFQHYHAKKYGGAILNVGCKEDPGRISECSDNVINLDVVDKDSSNGNALEVPNFVMADFLQWEHGSYFDTVVLGEVLEHCDDIRFNQMLERCSEVLEDDGHLIITVPQDGRDKYEQYGSRDQYITYREGITSWHQNLITKEKLEKGLSDAGFYIDFYDTLPWMPEKGIFWHLVVAKKIVHNEKGSE